MFVIPIIKPTSTYCNLRCRYCFYRNVDQTGKESLMEESVIAKLVEETQKANPQHAEFDWLGGEPTLAGLDFFELVVKLQKKYRLNGQLIVNKFQTNGTLIDESWVDFFSRNNFQLGVSIDGPQFCHDVYRRDYRNRGSYERVARTIKLLGLVPRIRWGTITVVSKANVNCPEEVYYSLLDLGVRQLAFNPVKGLERKNLLPQELTPSSSQYAEFIKRIFNLWWKDDDPAIVIRQFHSIIQGILGGRYRLCTFSGQCQRFFSVDYNGDIYPCEDDIPTKELCFGNIREGWGKIVKSAKYQNYCQLIESLRKDCLSCRWYQVCRGGCTRYYNISIEGAEHKNCLCEAEKSIFGHIYRRVSSRLPQDFQCAV